LGLLWRVNALQANFVLCVGGVKNGYGVAVGYVHDFALKGCRTKPAADVQQCQG
jgi:hypothetical protein